MCEDNRWAEGWAFYKGSGKPDKYLPPTDDCGEWIKGYAAAMADYDPIGDCQSIEASLRTDGIDGERLESLLAAAEALESSDSGEWMRWPSIPARQSAEALDERDKRILNYKGLFDEMG